MNIPSLEARSIARAFGHLKAVDDVSLTIGAGEIVVLLGQSGSGKSTLLRMLAGLEGLDAGKVLAGGDVVSTPNFTRPPEQRNFGMVFQDYALFPHLNARNNVAFGLRDMSKSEASAHALAWLDRVGLRGRADYFPHQLSGGEQQRVALARALAPKPKIVLMDEPFSGLDPQLRVDLQTATLSTLRNEGVGALIVSHDAQEAIATADKIAIMASGKIVQFGSPDEIYTHPQSLEAARALGGVWTMTATAINGVARTSLGVFPTTLSGQIIVAARPEFTYPIPSREGGFKVTAISGVGRFATLTLQSGDVTIKAQVEANTKPTIGASMTVTLTPENAFIFDSDGP
jgi:iron(III) transport system ATP-binding protein